MSHYWLRYLNCFSLKCVCYWPPSPIRYSHTPFHPVSLSLPRLSPPLSISPALPHHTPNLSTLRLQRWVVPPKYYLPPYLFSDYPPFLLLSLPHTACLLAVGPHNLVYLPHMHIQTHWHTKTLPSIWCDIYIYLRNLAKPGMHHHLNSDI